MENLVHFSNYPPIEAGEISCSSQCGGTSNSSSRNNQAHVYNSEFKTKKKRKMKSRKNRRKKFPGKYRTDLHPDVQSTERIELNVIPLKRHLQIVIMGDSSGGSLLKMDMHVIQQLLIYEINNIAYQQQGPELKFHSLKQLNNGWILLNCHDESTFEWVFDWSASKLRNFKTVKASAAPWKPVKICLTIPEMAIDINDVIKLLISQNCSLQLDTWKHIETHKRNGYLYLYFVVPSDGVRRLEGSYWKVHFIIETVQVSIVEDQCNKIS